MGWLTILMWLLSFFLAKNKGMSTGKAALLATGVAGATWLTIDPANKNSLWGDKAAEYLPDGMSDNLFAASEGGTAGGFGKNITDLAGTTVSTVGDVAKSWGPVGTVGAIAATSNMGSIKGFISDHPWVVWAGLGLGAYMLIKD